MSKEDQQFYDYQVNTIDGGCLPDISYLVKHNLVTGKEESIFVDNRGLCYYTPGLIKDIVISGRDVYLSFERTQKSGYVGKVVQDSEKGLVIQVIDVSDTLDEQISDISVQGSNVEVTGKKSGVPFPVSVSLNNLPTTYSYAACGR